MGTEGKAKLRKATRITVNNVCRETLAEIELFLSGIKSLVDESRIKYIDDAYNTLKNRIFDIGGEESRRIARYLEDWDVSQKDEKLDWIEFGPRVESNSHDGRKGRDLHG